MDRTLTYPGSLPLDTDILKPQRNAMIAMGFMLRAAFGTPTVADGLACSQTTVPSMSILLQPGSIVQSSVVDASAYGTIAADTINALVKMGINLASTTLGPFTAPGTAGQSQNHLIQATLAETDGGATVLPYYNATTPSSPWSGPTNSGVSQNTTRVQTVTLAIKPGTPATTGSQTTPAEDSGYIGLFVVTIANGAVTIVNANIARLQSAPFVDPLQVGRGVQPGRLLGVQTFTASGTYTPTAGMKTVIFRVQGGGAAGTGATGAAAGNVSLGAPGTSGAYAEGLFTSATVGASQVVTVGAGGLGVAGAAGNNGGTSSVGSLISAPGGVSSATFTNQVAPTVSGNGTSSSAASGGNIFASVGSASTPTVALTALVAFSGTGGASIFGPGAPGVSINSVGASASNPGTGGGGTCVNNAGGTTTGGAGFRGVIIATEYT